MNILSRKYQEKASPRRGKTAVIPGVASFYRARNWPFKGRRVLVKRYGPDTSEQRSCEQVPADSQTAGSGLAAALVATDAAASTGENT